MKKSVVIAAFISCWLWMPTSTLYAKDEKVPIPGKWQCALFAGGELLGYFTECSGIGSESEVIEHKVIDPDGKEVTRKIPGSTHFGNITLKRGITSDLDVWEWRQVVVDGDIAVARKNIQIVMYDNDIAEIARWHFENAWPIKVVNIDPAANGNKVAIEELTIAHEAMYREN